jgi:hypothetical protein
VIEDTPQGSAENVVIEDRGDLSTLSIHVGTRGA